jgi:predicted transposase/invertase (TIGR01784 family)
MEMGTRKFRIFVLELCKVKYAAEDVGTYSKLLLWMTFIMRPDLITEEIIKKYPLIGVAMAELKRISADEEFQIQWDAYRMAEYDRIAGEAAAMKAGKVAGKAEGIKETAIAMLNDGVSPKVVARYTGLSVEEVANLLWFR